MRWNTAQGLYLCIVMPQLSEIVSAACTNQSGKERTVFWVADLSLITYNYIFGDQATDDTYCRPATLVFRQDTRSYHSFNLKGIRVWCVICFWWMVGHKVTQTSLAISLQAIFRERLLRSWSQALHLSMCITWLYDCAKLGRRIVESRCEDERHISILIG